MSIQWSGEQKSIFDWFALGRGNLSVEARAGSAKTTTIIQGLNISRPDNGCYLVFNKLNQIEAQKKITNQKITVKTLHSIGFSILRNHWRGIVANGYVEFERIQTLYPDAPKQAVFQASRLVSYLKNTLINPTLDDAKNVAIMKDIDTIKSYSDAGWDQEKLAEMAMASIELSKTYPKNRKISFDDMVFLPPHLGIIKPQFDLIVLDESQDTNQLQMDLVIKLINPNGRICVVGDSLQNIYGFRGALSNGMELFEQKLNAKKLSLTTTYRCPINIVELAKQYASDIKAAPNAIDGEILNDKIVNVHKLVKVKDFILSRTNAPLMNVCFSLIKQKIPAYIEGREIGKALEDIIDIIKANSISEFYDGLDKWLAARQPVNVTPAAAQRFALCQDQAATLKFLADNTNTIPEIKDKIKTLFIDSNNVRIPSVVCMTIHKSKGRESDNIFILQDSFETRRSATPEEIQEELNIKYTAITRTKNKLTYLTEK